MSSTDVSMNTEAIVMWFDDLGSGNEEHRFLSNFYEHGAPLTFEGVTWKALLESCNVDLSKVGENSFHKAYPDMGLIEFATGEHAFAAFKFWGTDWTHFRDIVEAPGPNPAKSLGRSRRHPLRKDWEVVKYDVMCAVTRAKYAINRAESAMLLATGDKMLVEGTWWGDDVWGVDLKTQGLPGRNWLGTILMARRAELRAMKAFPGNKYVQHFGDDTVFWNLNVSR